MSITSEACIRTGPNVHKNEKDEREKSTLCCCEFIDFQGKKRHMITSCCDCVAVDDAFERLISRNRVSSDDLKVAKMVILDRIRIPFCNGRGAVRLSADVVLPICLIPGIILFAAAGPIWTAVAFIIAPVLGYYLSAKFLARNPRTPVFLVWALCSTIFLLAVMELEVIPYMEICLWENLLLKCFVGAMFVCVYSMRKAQDTVDSKSLSSQQILEDPEIAYKCQVCNHVQNARSSHCRFCGQCVVQRDHHCFWIDACIGSRNHRTFLLGLLFLICANYYGAMLTLTTVCQPILILDFFLIPTDCTGIYDDIHLSVCFVSAIYAVIIAAVAFWSLLKQLYLVSINMTMAEWLWSGQGFISGADIRRSHSRGIISNWYLFLRGQR